MKFWTYMVSFLTVKSTMTLALSSTTASTAFVPQIATPTAPKIEPHTFWRKNRSIQEVNDHVQSALDLVGDPYANESVHVISADPTLVFVHDFLNAGMCQYIVETAKQTGKLSRSTTGASQNAESHRTSNSVWLQDGDCAEPLRVITDKVAAITGLPHENMENAHIIRYEIGQEFRLHMDHQEDFNDLDVGGRLATCIVYLEEPRVGGETWFPGIFEDQDIKVPPTRGSAVFFWNSHEKPSCDGYDAFSLRPDFRTRHAGLPVEDGEKWICTRWVHPVDFGAGVRGQV